LHGRGSVAVAEPRLVDPDGERVDGEVRHGAEVRHGLHDREQRAGRDGGPREREHHAAEHRERTRPGRSGSLGETPRQVAERRARRQIDVGKQHHHEDERGASHAADLRKPVLPRAQSPFGPEPGLHRAGELQQVGVGVGDHVARHRQWQDEEEPEGTAAGKAIPGDQPAADGPHEHDTDDHVERKPAAGHCIGPEPRLDQMRPRATGIAAEQMREESGDRYRHQHRDDHGQHGGGPEGKAHADEVRKRGARFYRPRHL
jgi:hypothetical protein